MYKETDLEHKIVNATKWSAITNILRKLISPITNMILARILVPSAFGIVATINIVISFADIFTDAGFQKYLIQHQYKSKNEVYHSANVAFWTNFIMSFMVWILIFVFRDKISSLVGSEGYGFHLSIAALSIPLLSFSSIQQAIFKRNFDFKSMFIASMVNSLVPIFVTIPLALITKSCWALIIGTICANMSDAIILTVKSEWKPKFYYKFSEFKKMFGFSFWTLLEKLSIWLTLNIDTFLLGRAITKYYLGLYKTSSTTVNQISNLITAIIIPVLFSTLSRLQDNDIKFKNEFNKFQRYTAIAVIPMSVGIFVYRDAITWILLGNNWMEGSLAIGVIGLSQAFTILFSNFASEVYRAKGEPKISFFIQILYVILLIPMTIYAAKNGFKILCMIKIVENLIFMLMHILTLIFKYKFNFIIMFNNIKSPLIASIIMGIIGFIFNNIFSSIILKLITIPICMILYLILCLIFNDTKKIVYSFYQLIYNKFSIKNGGKNEAN